MFPGNGLVYDREMDEVTAFVLAGGKSSRMGVDKAFIQLGGRTLLDRALELTGTVATRVRILGSREKFGSYGAVVEDEFPEHGPLGGIHAALRVSDTDLNLILAVDMPFVDKRFLEYLRERAEHGTAMVTTPRGEGRWQPLCAIYRRDFAKIAEEALRADKNRIDPLFSQIELQVLEEAELTQKGFASEIFRNLNTPEELEAVRRI
jgi:molybdopterin-guanine dinucleotide biosynthesis protein A